MNDAFRGAVMVAAGAAFYLAGRLAVAHLAHRRTRRRHVTHHVFWLAVGLAATTTLTVTNLAARAGTDAPLVWQEWLLLAQASAITAGLRPLWAHHSTIERRGDKNPAP